MRIGIDAKWYFHGNISGRVVIVNLVKAIAENPGHHTYIIILNAKDKQKQFPYAEHPQFQIVYLKTFTNQLSNLLSPLLLRRFQLDLCIYQYFAPLFSSFKRVVYIHDIIFETAPQYFSKKEQLYFRQMKTLARHAHGIVTVSETEKKRLINFGYAGKKTRIIAIHNGVNDRFHNLSFPSQIAKENMFKKYGLPDKYVLYLGRINERKNIPSLIKAFGKANIPDLSLVIAGASDWSKTNIKQLIAEANLFGKVILTGFIEDEDIPALYQQASAFCFLSYDEGFGLPVAEAMMCGVPIVVSDTPINHEICGDAAVFVAPDDIDGISEAIWKALNKDESIQKQAKIGKQIAQSYKWSLAADKLLQFVADL